MGAGVGQTEGLLFRATCYSSIVGNVTAEEKFYITSWTAYLQNKFREQRFQVSLNYEHNFTCLIKSILIVITLLMIME
jgi:hypothetical protein